MRRHLIPFALLVVGINTAQAQDVQAFMSGNRLLDYCSAPSGSYLYGFCIGHITGVADAMTSYGGLGEYRACMPKPVVVEQVVEVAIQSLRANPAGRHLTAVSLIAKALAKAFPCR
jgi:Rap1a immunity proteins